MSTNFVPSREADLIEMSGNFNTKISADPILYSLTAGQAAAYAAKHDLLVAAKAVVDDPTTRSPTNIELKNVAKKALIAELRLLAGIVQRAPDTTNAMRIDLRITPRDPEPTPIPRPSTKPVMFTVSMDGRTMHVVVRDSATGTRRKAPGVYGLAVFSYVGEEPPENTALWKFEANTTKTIFDIVFPESLAPGTKVWATCFWVNAKLQSGPPADAISGLIQFGGLMAA